jgi:hypothetical protein
VASAAFNPAGDTLLQKLTFNNDDEVNAFLKTKPNNCYVVKFIVFFNPALRIVQQHYLISYDPLAKGGEHMRKGVPGNGEC